MIENIFSCGFSISQLALCYYTQVVQVLQCSVCLPEHIIGMILMLKFYARRAELTLGSIVVKAEVIEEKGRHFRR